MTYARADFGWLHDTGYGAGFHWTTATVPEAGQALAYEDAVAAFDVDAFVAQAVEMGVGHVLFTTTHSKHHFCGPNPEIDRILSGRTCKRDLIMELANGLAEADIAFLAYYNSGIHQGDPEWRAAVGGDDKVSGEFFDNWCRIIGWMGQHYGDRVKALWVDGAYELAAFENTPWEQLTAAAKQGCDQRLVCYNPGIERQILHTSCQDFWAGEVCRLNFTPRGEQTPTGLPWYAFLSWYGDSRKATCGHWVMNDENRSMDWTSPPAAYAASFLEGFQRVGGTVTFNLFCYQDGSVFAPDLQVMRELKILVRKA